MSEQKIEGVPIDGYPEYLCSKIGKVKKGNLFINDVGVLSEWRSEEESEYIYPIVHKIEKPKQYRPFANAEEFKPHRDRWWRLKNNPAKGTYATYEYSDNQHNNLNWDQSFELKVFDDDGTPFGVEVTG